MDYSDAIVPIAAVIVAGLIGYLAAYQRIFHDEKQKAYRKAIPVLARAIYDLPNIADEQEFNDATVLIWMYGSKSVARKFDKVLARMFSGNPKGVTQLMQDLIVAIRYDIRSDLKRLKAKEVRHIYAKIGRP